MKVLTALDEQSVNGYAAAYLEDLNLQDGTELTEMLAGGRPDKLPEIAKIAGSGLRGRAFSQSHKWRLATASPDAYNTFPSASTRLNLNVDGETNQRAGCYYRIDGVQVFFKSNEDVATVEELLQKFGLEFFYGHGFSTLKRPLHEAANTRVINPNAGNNTTTAIEGTRTHLTDTGKAIIFAPRERIVVCPTDTRCQLGGYWLQDYDGSDAPSAPAGATAITDVHVITFGKLYEVGNK